MGDDIPMLHQSSPTKREPKKHKRHNMLSIKNLLFALAFAPFAASFAPTASSSLTFGALKAAESEVSFDKLDGSDIRVGIIRTRWNDKHVGNLVDGCRKALKECDVKDENIFETSVPGSYELPLAARFLALSGTVDAIVTAGVLIKGETLHFEYISESVASGLMNVGLQTSMPIVYGVLNCMNEDQVKARSSGDNNHGYDWGKTAVEMALLRNEALNIKSMQKKPLESVGFNKPEPVERKERKAPGGAAASNDKTESSVFQKPNFRQLAVIHHCPRVWQECSTWKQPRINRASDTFSWLSLFSFVMMRCQSQHLEH
eukprot:scaffold2553_cov138-Cylindrotheca_fusiformis.AAC.8